MSDTNIPELKSHFTGETVSPPATPSVTVPPSAFDARVADYMQKNPSPYLVILTPSYGGTVFVNYLQCLINTMKFMENLKIKVQVEFCKNDSLVSRARNNLVAKAMSNKSVTHILFIDSDITWDPVDVLKLIVADKSLIGGVYPLKHYHWEKMLPNDGSNYVSTLIEKKNRSQIKNYVTNEQMVQYNMVKYNVNFNGPMLNIENNLTKVKHIATGFMMFKRSTIEQMQLAYPTTKYTDDVGFLQGEENQNAYALFDCGVEDDHYLSEDWLFCNRWTRMGGSVYLDVSINLTHTGVEDYRGSFIASIV